MSKGRFEGRGRREAIFGTAKEERGVCDNRKPLYLVLILDKSGSMKGVSTFYDENGDLVETTKIAQLNEGIKRVIRSLKDFESENPLYSVYLQMIRLDTYGEAVFPEFQPVSGDFEEICFEADGVTALQPSIRTLKEFISSDHLKEGWSERLYKGDNKVVSVILMSDGWPTDSDGNVQSQSEYRKVIDAFNRYLAENDYARNVEKYSVAVGSDAGEGMLRYFADGDENAEDSHFYRIEECASIASALDFLARASLAHRPPVSDRREDERDDKKDFEK